MNAAISGAMIASAAAAFVAATTPQPATQTVPQPASQSNIAASAVSASLTTTPAQTQTAAVVAVKGSVTGKVAEKSCNDKTVAAAPTVVTQATAIAANGH